MNFLPLTTTILPVFIRFSKVKQVVFSLSSNQIPASFLCTFTPLFSAENRLNSWFLAFFTHSFLSVLFLFSSFFSFVFSGLFFPPDVPVPFLGHKNKKKPVRDRTGSSSFTVFFYTYSSLFNFFFCVRITISAASDITNSSIPKNCETGIPVPGIIN